MRSFIKIWHFVVTNKLNEPFYIRELAKNTNTNPKDVHTWVEEARKNGFIEEYSEAGRTKYYKLNLGNQVTQKIVELLLATNASRVMSKEFFHELVSELAKVEGVANIILYGSHARGTASERSDVDLLIVVRDNVKPRRIRDVCEAVADRYARKVEPVVVTEKQFSKMLQDREKFIHNVMRDAITLYGFEFFINSRKESIP